MRLPIPKFLSVEDCYLALSEKEDDEGVIRFMAPDPTAGAPARYSVIELDLRSGQAICIGRELRKKHAKKIVKLGPAQIYFMRHLKSVNG